MWFPTEQIHHVFPVFWTGEFWQQWKLGCRWDRFFGALLKEYFDSCGICFFSFAPGDYKQIRYV